MRLGAFPGEDLPYLPDVEAIGGKRRAVGNAVVQRDVVAPGPDHGWNDALQFRRDRVLASLQDELVDAALKGHARAVLLHQRHHVIAARRFDRVHVVQPEVGKDAYHGTHVAVGVLHEKPAPLVLEHVPDPPVVRADELLDLLRPGQRAALAGHVLVDTELIDLHHLRDAMQHLLHRVAEGLQDVVNKLRLIVVGDADFGIAHQFPRRGEAAGHAEVHDRAPFDQGLRAPLPARVEPRLGKRVVRLVLQPVIHGPDRVLQGQSDGGAAFRELHAPAHPVAVDDRLVGLFQKYIPAEVAHETRVDPHAPAGMRAIGEGREVDLFRGRALLLPFLGQADQGAEDLREQRGQRPLEGHVIQVVFS